MGALAIVFNAVAIRRSIFVLPKEREKWAPVWWHALLAFAFFIIVGYLIAIVFTKMLHHQFGPFRSINYASTINLLRVVVLIVFLFCLFSGERKMAFKRLWRKHYNVSLWKDARYGILILIAAYPTVAFIEMGIEWILVHSFDFVIPSQDAVLYLRESLKHPYSFTVALFSILIFAPFFEELMFRGFLQTLLRKYIGPKASILITSLAFAFFHFTPRQSMNNIAIITALFALSLYLCIAYEKRRSLMTTISAHAAFNLFSTIAIIYSV